MSNPEFKIRPYRAADRDIVVSLWEVVFAGDPAWNAPIDVIERKLGVQPDLFLVGVLGERVVGTVLAGFDGVRGWVHHLAVLPELRRQGLAGQLMDRAEEKLLALGCPKLNLQVRRTNLAVVGFYESRGYAIDDVVSFGKPLGIWKRDADENQHTSQSSSKKR
jgi:ribosomal protein S18 acetylase RimI-like enzyme